MTAVEQATTIGQRHSIHANGAEISYVEAGQGEPLLLLHGGFVSTSMVWNGSPIAWVSHMATVAEHFRVIAPDTRGHGRTINPGGGPISYEQLADDVVALIDALNLERPRVCGFSDGGTVAMIVGIRHPEAAGAIVNDSGYDQFNPQAPMFAMGRQLFGGSPAATQVDPAAAQRWLESSEEMRAMFELIKADHDATHGPGYWKTLLAGIFDRWTQSSGYTFDDLQQIAVPALILAGDSDHFCSVEEAAIAYRMLQVGELAIVPGTGHWITPLKVQIALDFLKRHGTP